MTGQRLYEKICQARAGQSAWQRQANHQLKDDLLAWPFLSASERSMWNDAARRLTPKARKS